ncbi:MAG: HAD-IC family P-type ATPase [archaeon]
MDWHALESKSVIKNLGSSLINGLGEAEVKKRFSKFGQNVLREHKRKSRLRVFLGQFDSLLVWVLIVAAGLSALVGHVVDAVVIGIIILLNGGIGFFQEFKAEEIIEKLRRSLKYEVLVVRDGKQIKVDAKFLVPGDIVILNAGDKVLADCRILESDELKVNEAVLTGESFPIEKVVGVLEKDVVLADRKNMVYAGTTVVGGRAKVVVVETGHLTEFGKLAELVQTTENEIMPLEKRINTFSKNVSITVLILVAIVLLLEFWLEMI